MKLLLVEDVIELARLTGQALEAHGFRVDAVSTITEAEDALAVTRPDVIVLDLGLPDGSGLDMLARLRRAGDPTPILVVTARTGLSDRIEGLDLGADDYLSKPAAPAEIAARCRALLRRPGALLGTRLTLANIELDTSGRTLRVNDGLVAVARREVDILEVLLRKPGAVVTRSSIENMVYLFDETPGPNALEASISRLRKAFTDSGASVAIHTVRGVGYMIEAQQPRGSEP